MHWPAATVSRALGRRRLSLIKRILQLTLDLEMINLHLPGDVDISMTLSNHPSSTNVTLKICVGTGIKIFQDKVCSDKLKDEERGLRKPLCQGNSTLGVVTSLRAYLRHSCSPYQRFRFAELASRACLHLGNLIIFSGDLFLIVMIKAERGPNVYRVVWWLAGKIGDN